MSELKKDNINHPGHYISKTGLEAINVIESFELDYKMGNCIKYILRAGKKNKNTEIEDLKKAKWYLERKINELEKT